MNLWRSRISRTEEEEGNGIYEQYEKDYDLGDLGPRGLFKEYLEMSKIFFLPLSQGMLSLGGKLSGIHSKLHFFSKPPDFFA